MEKFNPQKIETVKFSEKETRYNQILLFLRNGKTEMAKRKNYGYLTSSAKKKGIVKGDIVNIESRLGESESAKRETVELVEINENEVVVAEIGTGNESSLPIETVVDIEHSEKSNY